MSKLHELANYGQSIWLDYIRRDILENGELQSMIDDGVRGMTSNPTIFEKAIAGGDLYDEDVEALAAEGKSALEIYDALSLKDIHKACELLSSVFKETEGADGYVSVEVSPELAHDTEKTIAEARRLREATPHDNLMIKVPATNEGIPAVKTLIAEGVNVNVTLIFSVEYYRRVAEAYIAGLEERAATARTSRRSPRSRASSSVAWILKWTRRLKRKARRTSKERSPSRTRRSPTPSFRIFLAAIAGRRSRRRARNRNAPSGRARARRIPPIPT